MTDHTKTTAQEIIRIILIVFAGIAIAGIFTAAVLGLCSKLPSIPASAAHEKEIESVLILNGDESIRLCSLEYDGKTYRPEIEDTGMYMYVTYYESNEHPITEDSIRKRSLKTATDNIVIFYVEE